MYVELLHNHISDSDRNYYELMNKGWTVPTRDCIRVTYADKESSTYIIFCGPFTKNEMCRDCATHYELSAGGKYYIIEKGTLVIMPQPKN